MLFLSKNFGSLNSSSDTDKQADFQRQLIKQTNSVDLIGFAKYYRSYFNGPSVVIFFNILAGFSNQHPQDTQFHLKKNTFFIGQMIDRLRTSAHLYSCRELAQVSYALGMLKIIPEDIFNLIAAQAASRISEAGPVELANLARNFARADFYHEKLLHAIARESTHQMIGFSPKEIATILKSFARLGFYDRYLMNVSAKEILFRADVLEPKQISDIAYAFAFFSEHQPSLFKMLEKEVLKKISHFEQRGIAKLVWSFAVISWPEKDFFEKIYEHILEKNIRFNVTEVTQLMTVDCYLKYKFKETHFVLFKEAASNTVFQKGKNNGQSKISDQIAKEVIGFIEDLQWNKNSYLEIFQLDLENREYKINIEIDGDQYHYDSRGRLFGRNAFRDQILNLMGWKVLRIKISFWKSMDIESRRIWLNNKLNPLIHSTQ